MIADVAQFASTDPTTAAVERGFCRYVAERFNGRILRYSQRLEMLKAAERLHINRFRANLIIAMIQHQAAVKPLKAEPQSTLSKSRTFGRMGPIIAGVLMAELATVVSLWWMLR